MEMDTRDALEVLKFEREFLEKGGYERSPKAPWRPQFIFEDSPTCMNYDCKENSGPCSNCVLMQLVPPERRSEKIPCRHIPLNEAGETVDSFYRYGTQEKLEHALAGWLRATITRLEEEVARQRNFGVDVEVPQGTHLQNRGKRRGATKGGPLCCQVR